MGALQVLNRATESRKNYFSTLAGLLVVMVFGWFLAFQLPVITTNAARDSATQSIAAQQNRLTTYTTRAASQSQWFAIRYTSSFKQLEDNASAMLQAATDTLTIAAKQSSTSAKIATYGQAEDHAQGANSAKTSLDQLELLLNANAQSVVDAQAKLTTSQKALNALQEKYGPLNSRFNNESKAYLSYYMNPLQNTLNSAASDLQSAGNFVKSAVSLLPNDTSVSAQGDPMGATSVLQKADSLVTSAGSSMDSVSSGLDYQKTAQDQAATLTTQAHTDVEYAGDHLLATVRSGGFTLAGSLSTANGKFKNALNAYQMAEAALVNQVEGKYDYPVAFEQAKNASGFASECVNETDRQVALRQSASDKIGQYSSASSQASNKIAGAAQSYQTLVYYHAASAWQDVSGNIAAANTKLTNASTEWRNANQALGNENYQDADSFAQNALNDLANISSLVDALVNKAATLESYRSQWSSAESAAQQEIDNNSGNVSSYRSYSSSAGSDYDSAVSLLAQAQQQAYSHDYAQAVSLAKQAQNSASGTGSRAYSAYQAEMQRRADEEAAAKRRADEAAAAAAQALLNQSSHSSYSGSSSNYGSDSTSSSSCCSSGSSDAGGFNDSSGPSDGGGW